MASTDSPPFTDGFIDFKYKGETFKTYYKLFGDLKNRTRTPIVALHGGPGLVHQVMLPFADLSTKHNIPTIVYDQIGNGKSTHLREKEPTFWTLDLFLDELTNLLNFFNIQNEFDLVGHSWGGIVVSEFAVRRQPEGLRRLILASTLASSELWNKSQMELVKAFPEDVQAGLAAGMKDRKAYAAALAVFHAVHGCTVKPFPEDFVYTLNQVFGDDGDPTVTAAPILKNWTIIDRAHEIKVPCLLVNGRMDISQDYVIRPFFERINKIKWVTFEKSSHTAFFEERDHFFDVLSDFLETKV